MSALLIGCDSKKLPSQNRLDFIGTTWAMHLKGNSYNFIWLSCDSTYIYYNDNIENQYYGRFEIKSDTLILIQKFEDDYHKYGSYPIKKKSLAKSKYLILNDSIIEFNSRDGFKDRDHLTYSLKQHFDCKSIYDK
jgi:hypothetical protein